MSITTRTQATFPPPVMEARRWIEGVSFTAERPLINVSQAAPVEPPPALLRAEMARLVQDEPQAHLYGPVLGLSELRDRISTQWSTSYEANITFEHVAVTAGCNQAFAAAIASLTDQDDEVLIPVPWYFNHKMCLDTTGVKAVPLPCTVGMLPDLERAARLITPRTKAITLVSPNNPAGVEYPERLIAEFYDLAKRHAIALIIDETYRDFDSRAGAPHRLFQDPDWAETVVHLYSFSKAYRLTGHRVGALISSPTRLGEVEKYLDTVSICPPQLGQYAALWGMEHLQSWLASERLEILDRRAAIVDGFPALKNAGWQLLGLGAYFAYLQHPFALPSDQLAQRLVSEAGVLVLPGTMFNPADDVSGRAQLRIAFANINRAKVEKLFSRLQEVRLPLAQTIRDA